MILFDTDVCISLLRGNRTVIEKRKQYHDQIAVSFMTVAELFYGAEKSGNPSKNKNLVEQFLITVNIINSNRAIMKRFGKLKADLERNGDVLSDTDILIAATALEICDLLVTGDVKRFSKIRELKLENWLG